MKKSLTFLSGICLALSSGLASAVTLNGWNVGNPTPVGATGLVNATKNVGGVAKVSNASIVPNASQVSKILRGGVAGVALTVAVNELLDGIDWVLDPVNNQIRYKAPDTGIYRWKNVNNGGLPTAGFVDASSLTQACEMFKDSLNYITTYDYVNTGQSLDNDKTSGTCFLVIYLKGTTSWVNNASIKVAYTEIISESTEKNLPLDTVSQKVIDKAEAGNTDAQEATVAATQDILNEAQNDAEKAKPIVQQLEANAIIAGNALYPNKISHDREDEIRQMKPNDPCDEISQAIKDLEETVKWRKSDLNPNDKGTKKYVGHQKRIKILNDKKDDLKRAYTVWCEGN
ncbi:hypothetical protein ABIC56_002971 [Acinetobacter bereziniae]|uniref:hypothetical protein n=1 Tax=Acinetobacter bereziniae TaxID=106648 RepID=UPI00285B0F8C|nr:hypothetical protein [Acinetobacter bereziniae]MDR6542996.1 hypothetical protein [Acinetobacter bereziniae]